MREVDPNYPIEAETGHNYYSIGNYEKAYENFTKANLNTMEEYIYYEYCFTAYVLDKKEDAPSCASRVSRSILRIQHSRFWLCVCSRYSAV